MMILWREGIKQLVTQVLIELNCLVLVSKQLVA